MTATIFETGISREETIKANPDGFATFIQGRMIRQPNRFIKIFSTAKRPFGPLHHTLFPSLLLRGCGPTDRCVKCAIIADPITQWSPDIERGGQRPDEHDAWLAANDLLNPGGASENCNLVARGLFVSINDEPTEEELKRAESARDARYRELVTKAQRLEASNPRGLNDFLMEEPDIHIAMDALGLQAVWHKQTEVKAICPNCGDEIRTGIAFHQSSAGVLCIIDAERAFKAGAINRERYEDLVTTPESAATVSAKKRV